MTFTHIQSAHAYNNAGSSPSVSFGGVVTSGNFVLASFYTFQGSGSPSITDDKGNAYPLIVVGRYPAFGGGIWFYAGIAFLANITNGPQTITVSDPGYQIRGLQINEFSAGSGVSAAVDQYNAATGDSGIVTPSITPIVGGELIYAIGYTINQNTGYPGGSWTGLNLDPNFYLADAWQIQSTAAPISATFTGGPSGVAMIASLYIATVVTADVGVPNEARALNLRADTALPPEMLYSNGPADNRMPGEYLSGGTIAADLRLRLEALGGGATFDTALPYEFLQGVDQPWLPIEWSSSLTVDVGTPFESLHIPIITTNAYLPIECLGAAVNAITGDSFGIFGWQRIILRDASEISDWSSSAISNLVIPAETSIATASLVTDALLKQEWSSAQLSNAISAAEALTTGRADVSALAVLGWQRTILKDGPELLSWSGSAMSNPVIPAETSAASASVLLADTLARLEWSSMQLNNATAAGEVLTTGRADMFSLPELLGTPLRDGVLPFEYQRALVPIAEALLRLEFAGRLRGDAALAAEGGLSLSADSALPITGLLRAVRDVANRIESLFTASVPSSIDSAFPLEFITPIRTDAGWPCEWALAVNLAINVQLPVAITGDTPASAPAPRQISRVRVRILRGR